MDNEKRDPWLVGDGPIQLHMGRMLIVGGLVFSFLAGVIVGASGTKDEVMRCVKECNTKHQEMYWVDDKHCACK